MGHFEEVLNEKGSVRFRNGGFLLCYRRGAYRTGSHIGRSEGSWDKGGCIRKRERRRKGRVFAELNNPKGQFSRGPLYVTLHDFNATIVQAKDPISGRYFEKDMIEIAKTEGCGWIKYSWTNKATKKVQKKKAWVQRVENMDLFTLCGISQD